VRLPYVWGATDAEVARRYPADAAYDGPTLAVTRAVSVAAPTDLTYRWLCQVSVAPYSYDLVDNRGRRSPTTLTPGADDLAVGQLVEVFTVTEVEPGHQWTGRTVGGPRRFFGDLTTTYAVEPDGAGASRLLCRIVLRVEWLPTRARAYALAWGDLVMMRKQLLTLKGLAERDARA
jgi:hypothetical protein